MATINDEYEKIQILGQGAYAAIWKVRHRKYGYIRTLKVLNTPVKDENDRAYQTFLKECTVLLNIGNGSNYNIVHIYHPRLIDNRAVVEMDFVDGETLGNYLKRVKFMPIDEVYRFFTDIVGALAYCHHDIFKYMINPNEDDLVNDPDDGHKYIIDEATEQLLVKKYAVTHNDLHSDNVMRRENDGSYVLLDFGLAIQNGSAVKSSARRGGALEYMAPEKFDDNGIISTQSDIYSMGILMYEVLAGRVPFLLDPDRLSNNPIVAQYEIRNQQLNEQPPAIEPLRREAFETANPGQNYVKDYPDWLENALMKCLAKNPEERFRDAKELYNFILEHSSKGGDNKVPDDMLKKLEHLSEKNKELESEMHNLQSINKSLNTILNEKQNSIQQLEQSLQEAQNSTSIASTTNDSRLDELNEELNRWRKSHDELVEDVQKLRDANSLLNKQLNEKQNLVLQKEKELLKANDELNRWQKSHDEMVCEVMNLRNAKDSLNKQLNEKQSEKTAVKDSIQKYCRKCGIFYNSNAKFCKRCGEKL